MQKADIARHIHQQAGISETQGAKLLDWILELLKSTLQEDKSITISGVGKFAVRSKRAGPGRNPQTGEAVVISARRVVTFHPSLVLKAEVNGLPAQGQEALLRTREFPAKKGRNNSMRTIVNGLMIGVVIMLAGCASLVSGTTQAVSFQSVPDDVTVTLITRSPEDQYWGEKGGKQDPTSDPDGMMGDSRILGKTPFTAQLERSTRRYVVFSKAGYRSSARQLTTGTTGAFWGNIISGGIPGSSTDTVSGAIYEYEPSHYLVTLTPLQSSAVEGSTLYSQKDKLRTFVLLRYASLIEDLSTGHGEDLSALLSMLHIESGKEAEAQRALLAMAQDHPDRAAFAATVTERYMK